MDGPSFLLALGVAAGAGLFVAIGFGTSIPNEGESLTSRRRMRLAAIGFAATAAIVLVAWVGIAALFGTREDRAAASDARAAAVDTWFNRCSRLGGEVRTIDFGTGRVEVSSSRYGGTYATVEMRSYVCSAGEFGPLQTVQSSTYVSNTYDGREQAVDAFPATLPAG